MMVPGYGEGIRKVAAMTMIYEVAATAVDTKNPLRPSVPFFSIDEDRRRCGTDRKQNDAILLLHSTSSLVVWSGLGLSASLGTKIQLARRRQTVERLPAVTNSTTSMCVFGVNP